MYRYNVHSTPILTMNLRGRPMRITSAAPFRFPTYVQIVVLCDLFIVIIIIQFVGNKCFCIVYTTAV